MKTPNFRPILQGIQTTFIRKKPEILIGIGLVGFGSGMLQMVKAVTNANSALLFEERLRQKEEIYTEITTLEKIKLVGKFYIPPVATAIISTACIIGGNAEHGRRNIALSAAYSLTETAFSEYRDKVRAIVGPRKEDAIRDEIAKDTIAKHPLNNGTVIIAGSGETLCLDSISGRYFKSDMETIKKAINILNRNIIREMYVSVNDFYSEIGLAATASGNDLGWNLDDGEIMPSFSSQISDDGRPCLVLEYYVHPRSDFMNLR